MSGLFLNLSKDEEQAIVGGINWGSIGAGLGIFSAVMISIACAPVTCTVSGRLCDWSMWRRASGSSVSVHVPQEHW